jgi:glycerophosphoryl diester phosphodiesterase
VASSLPPDRSQRSRPLVIAHRGASGYLPEHSLAAKALAHRQGADFLEQDVVATRDRQLIVFHDLWLEQVTDVAQRFPGRARADGHWYCLDFDLAEIRKLRITARRKPDGQLRYPGRPAPDGEPEGIPTLAEELAYIQALNASTGWTAGIYTEIKDPAWHRQQGVDLSAAVLKVLDQYGYRGPSDRVFLQCFDPAELRRVRNELGSRLPLVQLMDRDEEGKLPGPEVLAYLARTVDALGPSVRMLYELEEGTPRPSGFVAAARDAGLPLHPYTLRDDALPEGFASTEALVDFLVNQCGVAGFFTDFPDTVIRALNRISA